MPCPRPSCAAVALSAALLFSLGCSEERSAEPHVVLISVDGLRSGYFDDPRAPLDQLRKLAAEGARAEAMITSFPSVTWTSHTSIVTGAPPRKHGVLGNSVLDRTTGETVRYIGDAVFSKRECVKVETLYDAAHRAGLKTASIIWPATREAETIDWNIPDVPSADLDRLITPGLADELDRAGISIRRLAEWGWKHERASLRDLVYARTAAYLMRRHRPNLLLVHLVTPDAFEHDFGPDVEEAYWAVGDSDDRIRGIWDALQQGPLAGTSDLFVVSDHGFAAVERQIRPNVVLRGMGLVEIGRDGEVKRRQAWAHAAGGAAGVYVFDRENLDEITAELKTKLAGIEGVARVLGEDEFVPLGLPRPEDNPQQADLMLSAKPGYSFSSSAKGDETAVALDSRRGAHGHLPGEEFMHATFVAAGAHIKSGVKLGEISNLDVAPTIARILGVELSEADGRVLTDMLR